MIKHLFIVTSAINSRFGVYNPEQRLEQTVATIDSIKKYVPDAGIALMECTGISPTENQEIVLRQNCNWYLDYTTDPEVTALYKSTDNWDIVKNGTEIYCFGKTLAVLSKNNITNGYSRIHKMSGRYLLNDNFNPALYEQDNIADKIVIGPSQSSQFDYNLTLVERQYMARLWSWPAALQDEVHTVYANSLDYFKSRVANGGYVDIEHVLYKFLNRDHLVEVEHVGVEGTIAPNGVPIKN